MITVSQVLMDSDIREATGTRSVIRSFAWCNIWLLSDGPSCCLHAVLHSVARDMKILQR